MSSILLYEEGRPDLLWELIDAPDPDSYPEWVWFMRMMGRLDAGAALRASARSWPRSRHPTPYS